MSRSSLLHWLIDTDRHRKRYESVRIEVLAKKPFLIDRNPVAEKAGPASGLGCTLFWTKNREEEEKNCRRELLAM